MIEFDVDMSYLLECDELDKVVLNDENGEHEPMEFVPENATVGRRDTMELWPEWEQVLFANVSDEVAQDNLNECVHELLEKAATVGRSCESCPEMDNPDSYITHIHRALEWHDDHVPRPTNPRNTCAVLQGENPPEEVLFIHEDGSGVTHYLPEMTCKQVD